MNRYKFDTIFYHDPLTGFISPRYKVSINGMTFQKNIPILKGPYFGGLDIYNYIGRDLAGTWDATTFAVDIAGFYSYGN